MPDYSTFTPAELRAAQDQLSFETGESIVGALGGLPVASQNQEFFAVFDEAGSTGPEILDKTQFRITYIVNSQLETAKPTVGSPAAANMTQNFEKQKIIKVRADNATVLNQSITGEQKIYDVGTLKLISTTEIGADKDDYITTMSFDTVGGSLVGQAEDLSFAVAANDSDNDNWNKFGYGESSTKTLRASSISVDPNNPSYILYEEQATNEGNQFNIVADTLTAQTRIALTFSARCRFTGVTAGSYSTMKFEIIQKKASGQAIVLKSENMTYSAPQALISDDGKTGTSGTTERSLLGITTGFRNFNAGDKIYVRATRIGPSSTDLEITFRFFNMNIVQETPAGDLLIFGVNATTSSYWDGFNVISGSGIDPGDVTKAFSVLTASKEFSVFANGQYVQRLATSSQAFDPNEDGNTFNPIETPLQFFPGDEIRFEYNKNKVHKVIKTEVDGANLKVFIYPSIDTQTLNVFESVGTQLNHFTHYRIVPDGGYIFIDREKNNEAGVTQLFNGIITPYFTTEELQKQEDEVIFKLKQAGIIET